MHFEAFEDTPNPADDLVEAVSLAFFDRYVRDDEGAEERLVEAVTGWYPCCSASLRSVLMLDMAVPFSSTSPPVRGHVLRRGHAMCAITREPTPGVGGTEGQRYTINRWAQHPLSVDEHR